MKINHEDLIKRYSAMSSEELSDLYLTGCLTMEAMEIARDVLTSRSIDIPRLDEMNKEMEEYDRDSLNGVRGWLGILCVFLMVQCGTTALKGFSSGNPFEMAAACVASIGFIGVILMMFKINIGIKITKIYFWTQIVTLSGAFLCIFVSGINNPKMYNALKVSFILCLFTVTTSIIWLLYLKKSRRVAITFALLKNKSLPSNETKEVDGGVS